MPIHDWTRVGAGVFHHFHAAWIFQLQSVMNEDILPPGYYAMAEQMAGDTIPDVLALEADTLSGSNGSPGDHQGITSVATRPPKVRWQGQTEMDTYAQKQNSLVIRHTSGDRIVALVEIVSPGNKSSKRSLRALVEKAAQALKQGYHLLVLDLIPPGSRDPQGIHGVIWEEVADATYVAPPDKPLTLAAYDAGLSTTAYVEPVAVADVLPDMPLFLEPGEYVDAPLEATYQAAYRSVPERWRKVLEG